MEKIDLSVLIPSRNEMFLAKTVENILENIEGNTEIIVVLNVEWANPPIPQHPRVTVLYTSVGIGQRAGTNLAAKLARGKYLMKIDAHCAVGKGFDVKMMAEMKEDYTMLPRMYNLHAFDWVCKKCGNRWYQGPTPLFCCSDKDGKIQNPNCDSKEFERDIIWERRENRNNDFYRFDNTLHFQYWGKYKERPEALADIAETLSCQGSCFMITKKKYFELDISSEDFHSWGQQGVEVACKTWLSGGKLMANKNTWYAHMFRTQGGDFGFPYSNPQALVDENRELSRDLFLRNKWDKAVHPFSWLLKKFWPVEGWTEEDLKTAESFDPTPLASILYYTDNQLNLKIARAVQNQLLKAKLPITSVSLKPMSFGDNIHMPLKRGYLTMSKQILAGLKQIKSDVVFFTEHDVLYHPSHFDFVPPKKDTYYYNTNVWRLRLNDGLAVRTDNCQQLSGMCAYRELLIKHYTRRVELLEAKLKELEGKEDAEGLFNKYVREMGFEPGSHNREARVDDYKAESRESLFPNVDIRHESNLTPSRWSKDQFRNQKYTEGWKETFDIPGWGKTSDIL